MKTILTASITGFCSVLTILASIPLRGGVDGDIESRPESPPIVEFITGAPDESCRANCPNSGQCPMKSQPLDVTQMRVPACDSTTLNPTNILSVPSSLSRVFEGVPASVPAGNCGINPPLRAPQKQAGPPSNAGFGFQPSPRVEPSVPSGAQGESILDAKPTGGAPQ